MSNGGSSPFKAPRPWWKSQFSLATLMAAVTLASVLCALVAWLGLPVVIVLVLVGGPIGGATIVRIRKSKVDGDIAVWSGLVTVVLWGSVVVCDGIILALSDPNGGTGMLTPGVAAAFFVPYAFLIGISTGIAWEVSAHVLRESWQLVCRRVRVPPGPND